MSCVVVKSVTFQTIYIHLKGENQIPFKKHFIFYDKDFYLFIYHFMYLCTSEALIPRAFSASQSSGGVEIDYDRCSGVS